MTAPEAGDEQAAGTSEAGTPLLRVVSPNATPEEVAALVAVLTAVGAGEVPPAPRRTPEWQANRRKLRTTFPHGPGGWRASGLPH